MRKRNKLTFIVILALFTLMLSGCGKSEFGVTTNTEKRMVITAEKADKDAFFMVGSLEVEEGEQIDIKANLTKGSVRVEIIGTPEDQSIDEVPEMDGDPVITADLKTTEGASGTVPAGSYMLKATCLEKATGTIEIKVVPKE